MPLWGIVFFKLITKRLQNASVQSTGIFTKKTADFHLYLMLQEVIILQCLFFLIQNSPVMKNIIALLLLVVFLISCSRSVTMQQAASRSYRGSRTVR